MVDPEVQALIDAIPEDKRRAVWSVLGGELHKHPAAAPDSGDNVPKPGTPPPPPPPN